MKKLLLAALVIPATLVAHADNTLRVFDRQWTVPVARDWQIDQTAGLPVLHLVEPREPLPGPRRPTQFALTEIPRYSKLTIEAEVKPLGRSLIIVFAYQDDAHFNYVHLSTDPGTHVPVHNGVFHVYGGDRMRISKPEGPAAFPENNRWYHAKLTHDAMTGAIAVTVDGHSVPALRAVDVSLGPGKIGLGSFDETAEFRNLKITTTASAEQVRTHDVPGTLVETKPIANIDKSIGDLGGESLRVMYWSTASDGKRNLVGGALFVPPGAPPPGGWIVLGFGHGTTGILDGCGPSTSPNLFGMAPMIAGYIKAGYAVAFTDYQGLSGPGIHVYLDAVTEGYNIIDAVRAMHNAKPGLISKRWVTLGGSQGGGASWAAAEQAPIYAPELDLVAAVNIVPAADISGYALMAEAESMTSIQSAAYTALLIAQSRAHPELDMDLYRRGSVKKNWDALAQCYGPRLEERSHAVQEIKPEELKPSTHAATVRLQALLEKMALPQRKAEAPMLVIFVGQDQLINPAWTKKAIEKACGMGTKIQVDFQPDKTHGTFDGSHTLDWLKDRLAGKPIDDSCPY